MSADLFPADPPAPPVCAACAKWHADPKSGDYLASCDDCNARAIARSPAAWRALRGESEVEVRQAIVRVFGEDRWKEGRKLVWAWVQKLKEAVKA